MSQQPDLSALTDELARLYPRQTDSVRIVRAAGLNEHDIIFDSRATTNWSNIVDEADKQDKVLNIVREARKQYNNSGVLRNFEAQFGMPTPAVQAVQPPVQQVVQIPMPTSASDMTRLLRKLGRTEIRMVADEYAKQIGEPGGLIDRIAGPTVDEQAYELANHAARRSAIHAMQTLFAVLQKETPTIVGISSTATTTTPPQPAAAQPVPTKPAFTPTDSENPFYIPNAQKKPSPPKDLNRALSVFLSYSREDQAKVHHLYTYLQERGYKVWMDTEDLVPGQDWNYEIERAIRKADVFLYFLTEDVIKKKSFLNVEARLGLERQRMMPQGNIGFVPVLLEPCDPPDLFSGMQFCFLYEQNGFARLQKTLQEALAQRKAREGAPA